MMSQLVSAKAGGSQLQLESALVLLFARTLKRISLKRGFLFLAELA